MKNGPDSLKAINSAGEIHFDPLDATQFASQETVSGLEPGESSQKSSLKSVGIVFLWNNPLSPSALIPPDTPPIAPAGIERTAATA